MKLFVTLLAGAFLAGTAAADTVLFSFKTVQTAASNDVVRAQHFLEQTALNATSKCLDEGLFARKYWIAVANELNSLLASPEITQSDLHKVLGGNSLPRDRNSETMLEILLHAYDALYTDFAKQNRATEVNRALVEALRKGVTAALQARSMLSSAGGSAP